MFFAKGKWAKTAWFGEDVLSWICTVSRLHWEKICEKHWLCKWTCWIFVASRRLSCRSLRYVMCCRLCCASSVQKSVQYDVIREAPSFVMCFFIFFWRIASYIDFFPSVDTFAMLRCCITELCVAVLCWHSELRCVQDSPCRTSVVLGVGTAAARTNRSTFPCRRCHRLACFCAKRKHHFATVSRLLIRDVTRFAEVGVACTGCCWNARGRAVEALVYRLWWCISPSTGAPTSACWPL